MNPRPVGHASSERTRPGAMEPQRYVPLPTGWRRARANAGRDRGRRRRPRRCAMVKRVPAKRSLRTQESGRPSPRRRHCRHRRRRGHHGRHPKTAGGVTLTLKVGPIPVVRSRPTVAGKTPQRGGASPTSPLPRHAPAPSPRRHHSRCRRLKTAGGVTLTLKVGPIPSGSSSPTMAGRTPRRCGASPTPPPPRHAPAPAPRNHRAKTAAGKTKPRGGTTAMASSTASAFGAAGRHTSAAAPHGARGPRRGPSRGPTD